VSENAGVSQVPIRSLSGQEAIARLRLIARPVMFWTDTDDAPVGVGGTMFIVGLGPSLFLLTAKHVIRGCPVEKLLLLPCDGALTPFRVSEHWNVEDPLGDSDTADMFVMRTEVAPLPHAVRSAARVLDLNIPSVWDWRGHAIDSTFFVFGYPKSLTVVDYDDDRVDTAQALLAGRYVGPSISEGCYQIQVTVPAEVESLDGFSGSPVLSTHPEKGTRFCGIAILGGATSGIMHFISSEFVMDVLDQANERLAHSETEPL
jgi:hypothetical protein